MSKNIFDSILEAIDDCYYIDSCNIEDNNKHEINEAKYLVEQLRNNIIEQRNLNQGFMLQGARLMPPDFANKCAVVDATLLSILNMEVKND